MSEYKYEIKVERLPSDKPIGFTVLSDGVEVAVLSLREVRDALGEFEKRAEPGNEIAKKISEMSGYEFNTAEGNQVLIDAAAEIERLAALERPWLPIDSCPLTGKRVELWCQHLETIKAGQEYATFGHYEAGDDYEQWLDDHGYALSPTHWRDEPAGPNESKPDQEKSG